MENFNNKCFYISPSSAFFYFLPPGSPSLWMGLLACIRRPFCGINNRRRTSPMSKSQHLGAREISIWMRLRTAMGVTSAGTVKNSAAPSE